MKPRNGKSKRLVSAGVSTTLVNAAALQDHLVRNLNLSMPNTRVKKVTGKSAPSRGEYDSKGYRCVWMCDSCTLENDEGNERCCACGSFKPNNRRVKLTLAQKKGLVQAPPPRLNQNQWEECEAKAQGRGDTVHPCSICRESFGLQPKVILSCSHMFHHNCLTSFERFLRTQERVCPLCRKQNYQKRYTNQGEATYRIACVMKIQTVARGYLARKQLPTKWSHFYKSRRKAFFASKISKISERIVNAIEAREDSIDALLAEFDKSIQVSRKVFNNEGDDDALSNVVTDDKWLHLLAKAKARDEKECPICINPIDSTKTMALLSCTHMLHNDCLEAFEAFNIYEIHLCPVCRSQYESRRLTSDMATFTV